MSRFLIIPDRENFEETLKLCDEYNLKLELNDFMHPRVLDDVEKCSEITQFYSEYENLVATSHGDFYDVLVFSEDRRIAEISKQRIIQSMEAARASGAEAVIFHSNIEPFLTSDEYRAAWLRRNERTFREICAKYPDMCVYLENMFDTKPHDLAKLGEKMSNVQNFGICLDYAHAFISSSPLSTWAKELSPYIKHVHINDNDGVSDLHLAVGDGNIEWESFAKLREIYFKDASVLIETSTAESQRKSIEYLKQFIDFNEENDDEYC